jgi:4-hydroxy-2-oxoheptanedioate aldolase
LSDHETLKQRIRAGDRLGIAWASLDMDGETLRARLSEEDWDLVFVDAQHAPFDEQKLVGFCKAADDLGVPALLRIRHPRLAYLMGNYADLGPLGILVPLVETEVTADDAVEGFYYPPLGKRSWGPTFGFGRDEIQQREAYAQWWNAHGILALQIETVQAVANARVLAKPGVDLLLFGSNDLSFSLAANPDNPFGSIEACWRHVVDQTAGSGIRVACGMLPYGTFAPAQI